MTICKMPVASLQCGDQIIICGELKTIISLEGPDRIGTYDVTLQDNAGHKTQDILIDTVTLAR